MPHPRSRHLYVRNQRIRDSAFTVRDANSATLAAFRKETARVAVHRNWLQKKRRPEVALLLQPSCKSKYDKFSPISILLHRIALFLIPNVIFTDSTALHTHRARQKSAVGTAALLPKNNLREFLARNTLHP